MPLLTWDATLRPREDADVDVEPDGTVMVHWPKRGLTVLLSPDEARRLTARIIEAQIADSRPGVPA